ncbi:hypothetical protein [Paenibacillus contaminans]|nr:hypothetical protein [Paenibacillus contaminans]
MNNGNFFKELEKKTGIPGVGDKYELAQIFNQVSLRFTNPETDETFLVDDAQMVSFNINAHMLMPIFCITQVDSTSLSIVKENDDSVECKLNFGDQDIEQIIKDFGEHALLINPGEFTKRVDKAVEKQGIQTYKGKVNYEDYSVNSKERLIAQHNHDPNFFFYKRNEFAHQREYRIVLANKKSDVPYVLDIGDMSDISYLIETRKLFTGDFVLKLSLE